MKLAIAILLMVGTGMGQGAPGGAPGTQAKPVRVSGSVLAEYCIACPMPQYPANLKVSDSVVLSVIVGRDGVIRDATVVRGHAALRQAALDGVKSWRFVPYVLKGEAAEVTATVKIPFNYVEAPKAKPAQRVPQPKPTPITPKR